MMERCKNISPFVLLMYEDVKRCAKMCGKARFAISELSRSEIGETGTPAVINRKHLRACSLRSSGA